MTMTMHEPPTMSGWAGAQRYALREAARRTRSQRERSTMPHTTAVLLATLGLSSPIGLRPGALGNVTALSDAEVAAALAELRDAGVIEPGSDASRVGILMPPVLAGLGLNDCGIAADDVRTDVPPAGAPVELSDLDLTAAFAGVG